MTPETGGVQSWRRLGLLLAPDGRIPWMHSHASNPLTVRRDEGVRAYVATRDAEQRSHIASIDFDPAQPSEVEVSSSPVLEPGPLGGFADHGVFPSSIVEHEGRSHLYYVGINPGRDRPLFYTSIGLAVSEDGGRTFEPVSAAPLLQRGEHDPCLITSPCVLVDEGRWRMWYVSGTHWDRGGPGGEMRSWYHVKYAESADGIDWVRDGRVAIDFEHEGERNLSRPCVVKEDGRYRMWFSYCGDFPYRLGYAESEDGYEWTRMDDRIEAGPPDGNWDSDAVAQPWVFTHGGSRYMVYCGNAVGRDGFGLAVQDSG